MAKASDTDVFLETVRRPRTRIGNLLKLGTPRQYAVSTGLSRKGYWRLSRTLATQTGMTNEWLAQQGLPSIRDLWMKAQGYEEKSANSSSRTAHCGAARWVVWEGGFVRILPIPIRLQPFGRNNCPQLTLQSRVSNKLIKRGRQRFSLITVF